MSTRPPQHTPAQTEEVHSHDEEQPSGFDGFNRRDFMRVSGTLAAAGAISAAGCMPPGETSLPFDRRPEGLRSLGQAQHYATVLDGAPVLVRVREGRPILIAPNPRDPSGRALTVRSHAALLDLYDPDRVQGPLSILRQPDQPAPSDWAVVSRGVVNRLKARQGDVVLLTAPLRGPATRAAVRELITALGFRHVEYSPLVDDAAARAWQVAFPGQPPPRPQLDRAELIVGFGCEFLDQPADGLDRDFARRRDPASADGMSRFVQCEGRLSLTGANADQRIRVRDSQLGNLAAAVAHVIIVVDGQGPLAGNAAVQQALAPFAPEVVAAQTGVEAPRILELARSLVAARGRSVVLAGGSASASASGLALETAVLLINHSLGNDGGAGFDHSRGRTPSLDGPGTLARLAEDLKAKKVSTLILAGVNPVYDAPAEVDFAAAMANAQLVVSLNDRLDETAALADFLAPLSHPLEAWGDDELGGGVVALQQPVIRPLYDTHGLLDVLVAWGAAAGVGGAVQAAASQAQSQVGGPLLSANTSAGYHFLQAHWLARVLPTASSWDEALRVGHHVVHRDRADAIVAATDAAADSQPAAVATETVANVAPGTAVSLDTAVLALLGTPAPAPAELELQLYPHYALHDGRSGNNGWLHELPDPITRLTWGGAASIAPRRFDALGLRNGDLVELRVGQRTLTLPAYRHAGMHQDQIAVPLGLGRTRAGEIGAETGVNAFGVQPLVDGRALRAGLPVTLRKTGGFEELAGGQGADVLDRSPRPLLPVTTLSAYTKSPAAGTEQIEGGPSAWPEHPYENQRWAMAIDLSRCNGCGQCSLGCQAENNIPIVGRQNIIDGREMSWIRIDRYYDAPHREGGWGDGVWDGPLEVVEEPTTLFEPMLCQHCENAPCETVCPFNATMHSSDGLNQQIYNRCVGTRYCANNCPFKVRRYNWYEYSLPKTSSLFKWIFPRLERHAQLNIRGRMQMKNNPEVTVRSRGVMEKCSFCIQRIREARAQALRDGHKGQLADGAVVPACMEVCPTGAIVFGDINDPTSRVSQLARNPRAMRLLDSLGVKPAVSYLSKVRNDKA